MIRSAAILLLPGLLLACVQPQPQPPAAAPPPAPAAAAAPAAAPVQADRYVNIRRATCATYLGLSPDDRGVATMFYIGYEANRFRTGTINVALIPSIEGMAQDFCAAQPNRTVASAFAEAFAEARRW